MLVPSSIFPTYIIQPRQTHSSYLDFHKSLLLAIYCSRIATNELCATSHRRHCARQVRCHIRELEELAAHKPSLFHPHSSNGWVSWDVCLQSATSPPTIIEAVSRLSIHSPESTYRRRRVWRMIFSHSDILVMDEQTLSAIVKASRRFAYH